MAQNPELEAQIAKSPDDPAAYTVYADWLSERGDPRGELMTIQLRLEQDPGDVGLTARQVELFGQHGAAWLGPLAANKDAAVEWRRGFIDRVVLGADDYSNLDPDGQVALYAQLRALPAAALLRDLTFGAIADDDGQPHWQHAITALVEHGVPASLRGLAFDRGSYWDISWTHLYALEPAYALLANLERLRIELGHMDLGTITLPALRSFEVHTGGFTKDNMRSIASATWPRLESLVLTFGDSEDYGAECELEDVLPLFDERFARRHEHLRHLAIANAGFVDDAIPLLAKAPILRQLRSLDLSQGLLGDAGVNAIVAHADAFRNLERIDISDSYVGGDAIAALRKVVQDVQAEDQKDADDDYRYCSIGE